MNLSPRLKAAPIARSPASSNEPDHRGTVRAFCLLSGISGQGGQDWDLLLTDVEMQASQKPEAEQEGGQGFGEDGTLGWPQVTGRVHLQALWHQVCGLCARHLTERPGSQGPQQVFHLNCFTCMVCNKQLSTGEELYVIDENKFVCKDDY